MKKIWIVLGAIAIVLVLAISMFVGYKNSFVDKEADAQKEFSNIEVALQRRGDLIPNLVESVKGYVKHESEVFTHIADARTKLYNAIDSKDGEQMMNANNELSTALGGLNVIVEAYPELKADKTFINLQDELAGTENRISTARQHYNDKVTDYNKAVKRFPGSFFAGIYGYDAMDLIKADPAKTTVPEVSF